MWFMNGPQVLSVAENIGGIFSGPQKWTVAGVADFNGDGKGDLLWSSSFGGVAVWLMNGAQVLQSAVIGNAAPDIWKIAATGDFDGDGKSDILWRDNSGNVAIWFLNGAQVSSSAGVGNAPAVWSIQGVNAD